MFDEPQWICVFQFQCITFQQWRGLHRKSLCAHKLSYYIRVFRHRNNACIDFREPKSNSRNNRFFLVKTDGERRSTFIRLSSRSSRSCFFTALLRHLILPLLTPLFPSCYLPLRELVGSAVFHIWRKSNPMNIIFHASKVLL